MKASPDGAGGASVPRSQSPKRGWGGLFSAPEFYRERADLRGTGFERLFEPAVLVLTITLFMSGLVQFGLALAPAWRADGLAPLCAVVAAAAYLYSRRLARGVVFWREWLVLLALPVLLARLLPYLGDGSIAEDVALWIRQPASLFDAGFIVALLLLLLAWSWAFYATQDLNDLRVQPGELPDAPARTVIERAWESDRLRAIDHTEPLRRLIGRALIAGIVLIIVAALTASSVQQLMTIDALTQLVTFSRPSSSLALVNVVAYFVAVLLLLAEAQYVRSRTLWQLDRVEIAPGIPRRWGMGSVALVLVGLLAAALAPTEGLLGLGEIVRFAAAALLIAASVIGALFYLLFWVVTYPLRWLLGSGNEDAPSAPPFQMPPIAPAAASGGSFVEVLKSALFWIVVAALLTYAIVSLWRQGKIQASFPAGSRFVERLLGVLGALLGGIAALLRRAVRGAAAAGLLVRAWAARGVAARPGGRLGDLLPGRDPRRVVIAIYLLLLARAGERGLDRRPNQTALEYRQRLRESVPDVAADVDNLTDTFLRARYGPRPIEREDASLARRCWEHIRARLRRPATSA